MIHTKLVIHLKPRYFLIRWDATLYDWEKIFSDKFYSHLIPQSIGACREILPRVRDRFAIMLTRPHSGQIVGFGEVLSDVCEGNYQQHDTLNQGVVRKHADNHQFVMINIKPQKLSPSEIPYVDKLRYLRKSFNILNPSLIQHQWIIKKIDLSI